MTRSGTHVTHWWSRSNSSIRVLTLRARIAESRFRLDLAFLREASSHSHARSVCCGMAHRNHPLTSLLLRVLLLLL